MARDGIIQRMFTRATGIDEMPVDTETSAWALSLLAHVTILVLLTSATFLLPGSDRLLLTATPPPLEDEIPPEEFRFSDEMQEEMGALADAGATDAAAAAPLEALESEIVLDISPVSEFGDVQAFTIDTPIFQGPTISEDALVQGVGAVGSTGAEGAVDRITHEILLSIDQRPTLVIWLFDQSGSLKAQREEILTRFDRVYDELGVIQSAGDEAFKKYSDKPLLTTVASFGARLNVLIEKPTDDLAEIKATVRAIADDDSGQENVFGAIAQLANQHKTFRLKAPRRNVMLVVFTDEAGDDLRNLDAAVSTCRKLQTPVYVVGVPAPFGRQEAYVKYVDPDPKYDQSPQYVPVNQGPESMYPERVKLDFIGRGDGRDQTLDSGFGPFGLSRLAYETGGVYFSVHPNRRFDRQVGRRETEAMTTYMSAFFDPRLMRRYRPDYVTVQEYQQLASKNKARAALVQAAGLTRTGQMERVRLVFPKIDDPQLVRDLTNAQRAAAKLEPKVIQLASILKAGEKDRDKLDKPRWQVGYDLAIGRALATKVRTEGYNEILARAKQGMKFENEKSDTWILKPSDIVSTSSVLAREAKEATRYLQRVVTDHPGTPWALLAKEELATPFGWEWKEEFRDVAGRMAQANNGPNRQRPEKMAPRKERRPPPKL